MKELHQKYILFISSWYPNRYDPMPGLFVRFHAEAASKYCPVVVLYAHTDQYLNGKEQEITFEKINHVPTMVVYFKKTMSQFPLISSIVKFYRFYRAYSNGFKRIKEMYGDPKLIHGHILQKAGLISWIFYKIFKYPYLLSEHWSGYLPVRNEFRGWLNKLVSKWIVKCSKAVLVVTKSLGNAMKGQGLVHDNYILVPNVVDCHLFTPGIKDKPSPKKTILHVSCFDEKAKNIRGIINTIYRISRYRNDFQLQLVGGGRDKKSIEQHAGNLGLTGSFVFFEGVKEGKELAKYYQNADFFVLFSHYENIPVVINESFACGIPVIATRTGGIPEYVNDTNGLLVKPGDERELEEQINVLLDRKQEFDPPAIRHYAEEHLSFEAIGKQLCNIYSNIAP